MASFALEYSAKAFSLLFSSSPRSKYTKVCAKIAHRVKRIKIITMILDIVARIDVFFRCRRCVFFLLVFFSRFFRFSARSISSSCPSRSSSSSGKSARRKHSPALFISNFLSSLTLIYSGKKINGNARMSDFGKKISSHRPRLLFFVLATYVFACVSASSSLLLFFLFFPKTYIALSSSPCAQRRYLRRRGTRLRYSEEEEEQQQKNKDDDDNIREGARGR